MRAHQNAGHTVVIATSATQIQAEPLARELGVEHVLCTRLEERDGVLTGGVSGRTLWGPGKLAAVQRFAADPTVGWDKGAIDEHVVTVRQMYVDTLDNWPHA